MGRNPKVGLDYFPLDTAWDIKMQLVKAKYGLEGVGCIVELFKLIYSEGYALKWDDDTRILFASSNHIDENTLDNILIYSVEKGIFHRGIYDKLRILTSSGIQKRWVKIVKDSKRSVTDIERSIDLNTALWFSSGYTPEETSNTPEEMPHMRGFTTGEIPQRKVKEIKEEDNKENTCTSYSTDSPPITPEEARAPISEPEPEAQEPGAYPKAIYAAWQELGAHVYQPASLWTFSQKWEVQVRPHLKGIPSQAVMQAIANLKTIYDAPPGTYYWTQKIGVEAFFSKHLEKFLPANFSLDDFKVRPIGWEAKKEADEKEEFEAIHGKDYREKQAAKVKARAEEILAQTKRGDDNEEEVQVDVGAIVANISEWNQEKVGI